MLLYKTKNGTSPSGKNKVYFCCHPQDFETYFESISDELLSMTSCAIWYCDATISRDEQFYNDLAQMKLVVVPITSRLLKTDNAALNEEIPFILDHHIPVLPLMQERELETVFTARFHELQFLDRCSQDDTAISYQEKLNTYLKATLIGDEMMERVRQSFSAQLFLSYRKKDRRYAQQLMALIHTDPLCQDVAIWYDEFLTPGEDFNKSIESALNSSAAFVMAVTPNLTNETNYIQTTEYPFAQRAGKPIIPVEMMATDHTALAAQYPHLPACISAEDLSALHQTLRRVLAPMNKPSPSTDAEHTFLIGMAYLNGIDVEVNHLRALEMITASAEAGNNEAIAQLVYMYQHGDGVKRNLDTAAQWQEKLVEVAYAAYTRSGWAQDAKQYGDACITLVVFYQQMKRFDDAIHFLDRLQQRIAEFLCAPMLSDRSLLHFQRLNGLVYAIRAEIAHSLGNFEDEERYTDTAAHIFEELCETWESDLLKRDLSVVYRNRASLYRVKNDSKNAIHYALKALRIQEEYAEQSDNPQQRFDLAYTYHCLAELHLVANNFRQAQEYSLQSLQLLQCLIQEERKCVYLEWLGAFYLNLANAYRMNGETAQAMEALDETEKILVQLENTFGDYQWLVKYYCLFRRAQIYLLDGRWDNVIALATLALQVQAQHHVVNENNPHSDDDSLLSLHYILANAYQNKGNLDKMLHHAQKSVACADLLCGHNNLPIDVECATIYSYYASILTMYGQMDEAKIILDKAAKIAKENAVYEETFNGAAVFASVWFAYGRLHLMYEETEKAFTYFLKAEQCYETFFRLAPTITTPVDLVALYYNMGCCQADDHPKQAKAYFLKTISLAESIPVGARQLPMWEIMGFSYYFLCVLTDGAESDRWIDKLVDCLEEIDRLFPDQFLNTQLYQMCKEWGVIED